MKIREKDFLRAVKRADSRFYTEVRQRISDAAARKRERLMEKKEKRHITGKFVIAALIAAAVLGGGGIVASVAMRGNDSINIFKRGAQADSSTAEVQTTEEKPVLHLTDEGTYTDQTRQEAGFIVQGEEWFTETEDGCYFSRSDCDLVYDPSNTESFPQTYDNMKGYYCFKDKETGKAVPLCARPNCLHDGSEYCVASTKRYSKGKLFAYEGQLYTVGTRVDEDSIGKEVCVLRYAPDGSGIEELVRFRFPEDNYRSLFVHKTVMYRGYLFASVSLDASIFSDDAQLGSSNLVRRGGAVVCYELSTGKAYILNIDMPEQGKTGKGFCAGEICGMGDRLYLRGDTVRVLDLNTMEMQTAIGCNQQTWVQFGNGKIFYLDGIYGDTRLMRYDCETGTEERVQRLGLPANTDWQNFVADDKYLYALCSEYNEEKLQADISLVITDYDCKLIAQSELPLHNIGYGPQPFFTDGEYLYASVAGSDSLLRTTGFDENGISQKEWNPDIDPNNYLVRIRISDLLKGKGGDEEKWEKFLTISEVTLKAAHIDSNMQITYH